MFLKFAVALALILGSGLITADEDGDTSRALSPFAPTNMDRKASSVSNANDDDARSLALVLGDPFGGQSMYAVTNGVHHSALCNSNEADQSPFRNLFFCNVHDETMYYGILPWYIDPTSTTGVREPCPLTKAGCFELNIAGESLENCLEYCGDAVGVGEECSDAAPCQQTLAYCKQSQALDTGAINGVCTECPENPEDCLMETDDVSKRNCLECELTCQHLYWGDFTVEDKVIWANGISSQTFPTTVGSATGPIVDCNDLLLNKVLTCPGAKDSICLVHDHAGNALIYLLAQKCEKSGGVALVYYKGGEQNDVPADNPLYSPVNIPTIAISYNAGLNLHENGIGSFANVSTYSAGTNCWTEQHCSGTVPCLDPGNYCIFPKDETLDDGLWCFPCPEACISLEFAFLFYYQVILTP